MLVQLTTKNFRGHLSKQGKISKVPMLFFSRKKSTVTLEYSKLDESTSEEHLPHKPEFRKEQRKEKLRFHMLKQYNLLKSIIDWILLFSQFSVLTVSNATSFYCGMRPLLKCPTN